MKNEGYTYRETLDILKRHGITPRKGFGQNFLTDKNILSKIIDAAKLENGDQVLEIGPGIGTLTRELASKSGRVVCVEIDDRLIPILQDTTSPFSNITIVSGDILRLNLNRLYRDHFREGRIKVVANLPYYITSPIVMKLLEAEVPLKSAIIMVQKEVALRMSASPGSKDYGALSVAVQFYSSPEMIASVPPTVFIPPPKVSSAIVRLDIKEFSDYRVKDTNLMFSIVKAAFGKRRKTLLNALVGVRGLETKEKVREALKSCGIEPERRGETLSVQDFCRLADCIIDSSKESSVIRRQ